MGGNFKFQVQDSFLNIFFSRFGDLKNESHFLKKSHLYIERLSLTGNLTTWMLERESVGSSICGTDDT